MPDLLSDAIKLSIGYKHALGNVNTDTDKAAREETLFTAGYITGDEVLVSRLPFNDPASAVTSGVVSSGLITMDEIITVGGGFRAYSSANRPVIHPEKHGNLYAPCFFHSSGTPIPQGDLDAYTTFYFDVGVLVIEKNATTNQWLEPIDIDAYFYQGLTAYDLVGQSGGSGDVTFEQLTQVSGELQIQIDNLQTQINNLQVSGQALNGRVGKLSGSDFSGKPLSATITFAPAFDTEDISITLSSTVNRNFYIEPGYTSGGCTVTSSSNRPLDPGDEIFYHAFVIT